VGLIGRYTFWASSLPPLFLRLFPAPPDLWGRRLPSFLPAPLPEPRSRDLPPPLE
jgi:hypothetical protein